VVGGLVQVAEEPQDCFLGDGDHLARDEPVRLLVGGCDVLGSRRSRKAKDRVQVGVKPIGQELDAMLRSHLAITIVRSGDLLWRHAEIVPIHEKRHQRLKLPRSLVSRPPTPDDRYAAPALFTEDEQEVADRFDEALGADLPRSPLQRARLLLAYGQWLGRQRRIAESRARCATPALLRYGRAAWGDQARRSYEHQGSPAAAAAAARPRATS